MKLKTLDQELSVCKVVSISDIDLNVSSFSSVKLTKKSHLYALRQTSLTILRIAPTAGGLSG